MSDDKLCDECHGEYQLTLAYPSYSMLCHLCLDRSGDVGLLEVVQEAQNLRAQQEAMKKVWEEIDKIDKKGGDNK